MILIYIAAFVMIFSVYLFLVAPACGESSLPRLLIIPYAHRGLHSSGRPENSMAAFRSAIEAGCGIELDARLTKDGEVIVFHDEDLSRACKTGAAVSSLTFDEISKYLLFSTSERIPKLSDVLGEVCGKVPLLIELKGSDTALCDRVFELLDVYGGAFCVEAFDPRMLYYIRKKRPSYYRGQLVTKVKRSDARLPLLVRYMLSHMMLNFISRPHFIACDKRWSPKVGVFIASRLFYAKVFLWVVSGEDKCKELYEKGIVPIFEY